MRAQRSSNSACKLRANGAVMKTMMKFVARRPCDFKKIIKAA
jgi:hypothetical protein